MQNRLSGHRPPHCFSEKDTYFITASTFHKQPLFADDSNKRMLRNVIREMAEIYKVKIYAFALMDSHYHLLLNITNSGNIPDFVRSINGKSASSVNRMDGRGKGRVWYNYWDTCIKEEREFWARFNYIHHNPVKHGCVRRMEDYAYSSYARWLKEKGEEWMNDLFVYYSIVDFTKGDE